MTEHSVTWGDSDFNVEHIGVTKRQRAGTLERVVKYDREDSLIKAWAWLANSPSDDEEEYSQKSN